MTPYAFLSKFL